VVLRKTRGALILRKSQPGSKVASEREYVREVAGLRARKFDRAERGGDAGLLQQDKRGPKRSPLLALSREPGMLSNSCGRPCYKRAARICLRTCLLIEGRRARCALVNIQGNAGCLNEGCLTTRTPASLGAHVVTGTGAKSELTVRSREWSAYKLLLSWRQVLPSINAAGRRIDYDEDWAATKPGDLA
jgi:hypothetical protein